MISVVMSVAQSASPLNVVYTVLLVVGNVLILWYIVRPVFQYVGTRVQATQEVSPALVRYPRATAWAPTADRGAGLTRSVPCSSSLYSSCSCSMPGPWN